MNLNIMTFVYRYTDIYTISWIIAQNNSDMFLLKTNGYETYRHIARISCLVIYINIVYIFLNINKQASASIAIDMQRILRITISFYIILYIEAKMYLILLQCRIRKER